MENQKEFKEENIDNLKKEEEMAKRKKKISRGLNIFANISLTLFFIFALIGILLLFLSDKLSFGFYSLIISFISIIVFVVIKNIF